MLVHGNAGSAAVWARVLALLPDVGARALDLPGFGGARDEEPAPGDLLDVFVEPVVSAAQVASSPVVLAGNGIGAVLCAHAARRLGDACRGVLMIGPVGLRGGHARLGWMSRSRAGAAVLRVLGVTAFGRGRFLGDQLAKPRADVEAARILCTALLQARGFHRLARLNRPESLAGLRGLRCPVTVLWGASDGVLPASRASEFLTHLPDHARLETVAGASHALPLERPDLVAAEIRRLAGDPD